MSAPTTAVVVSAGTHDDDLSLAPAIARVAEVVADRAALHLLHLGLSPRVARAVAQAHPGLRFVGGSRQHYRQFASAESSLDDVVTVESLVIEGFDRVVVLPAAAPDADEVLAVLAGLLDRPSAAGAVGLGWVDYVAHPSTAVIVRDVVPGATPDGATPDGAASGLSTRGLSTRDALRAADRTLVAKGPQAVWEALVAGSPASRLSAYPIGGIRLRKTPETDAAARRSGIESRYAGAVELFENGDYEGSRDLLIEVIQEPGGLIDKVVNLLARALRATSDYDRARNVLLLTGGDAVAVSRAKGEAADIAWVQHDYAAGMELAVHSLRANPANRRAEITLQRLRHPYTTREQLPTRTGAAPVLSHVAFYVSDRGNFGDVVLPPVVREAVTSVTEVEGWLSVHAHQLFDEERLELVNETDGVVIGGGGLFLPDTAPNGNSGWQWNIPRAQLEKIDVPLGIVGVGFNLFQGQSFVGTRFRDNLIPLVERASMIGLRNHGSVAQVRRLLPEHLGAKVRFLPCPTTVLRHIHRQTSDVEPGGTGTVLINTAFDRAARRFGDTYGTFLSRMAAFVRTVRDADVDVRFAAHLPSDEKFVTDLSTEHGIALKVDPLYDLSIEDAYDVYRRAGLVIGMRGHATMIPFGLGTPVLSIISHPKMRYFLEDIGRADWGFDVHSEDLAPAMAERALEIVSKEDDYREDVARLQLDLLRAVQDGVSSFTAAVTH